MTTYTDWLDWYDSDPLEMVCNDADAYHTPVPLNEVSTDSPVDFLGGSQGFMRFSRDFGGEFPQDVGGLQYAWVRAKTYGTANILWSERGGALSGSGIGVGAGGTNRGGYYHGSSGGSSPFLPTAVTAEAYMSGWGFQPADALFDAWSGPLFENDNADGPDPALYEAYLEAVEANSPGDDWYVEWEHYFPTFVGYQIAPDELMAGTAVSDGTIHVGINASGTALNAVGYDLAWEGPGAPSAAWLTSYGGGLAPWVDVPADWIPGQDPVTGQLTPADTPLVTLNCYIEYATRVVTAGLSSAIELDPASTMPDGYSLSFGKERLFMSFAVKALWRPARFRFARDITTVVRQYPRDDGQGISSATRLYPPPKRHRLAGGYQ